MGQKVSPHGFRVGVVQDWDATWYATKQNFAEILKEDSAIRRFIEKKYKEARISRILIERKQKDCDKIIVTIFTGSPGVVIGQKGAEIETLRKELKKLAPNKEIAPINVKEVKNIDADATLVAQSIAAQIEKRVLVKRAMKSSIQKTMKAFGVLGCKIMVKGRINGAEMARTEQYAQGSVPLQTIRADVDFGRARANTTYGVLGISVWIYKGEILKANKSQKQGGEQ